MPPKSEDFPAEFKAFLESCPEWRRRFYLGEPFQAGDLEAWGATDPATHAAFDTKHDVLLRRYPKLRAAWERVAGRIVAGTPRTGRPRKDNEADEAIRMHSEGRSYGQIGRKQGRSPDAARKLAKSRQPKSTGKKSD